MHASICKIIGEHKLSPGSAMKNVNGHDIERSTVLSPCKFLLEVGTGVFSIEAEDPVDGDRTSMYLDAGAVSALKTALNR